MNAKLDQVLVKRVQNYPPQRHTATKLPGFALLRLGVFAVNLLLRRGSWLRFLLPKLKSSSNNHFQNQMIGAAS